MYLHVRQERGGPPTHTRPQSTVMALSPLLPTDQRLLLPTTTRRQKPLFREDAGPIQHTDQADQRVLFPRLLIQTSPGPAGGPAGRRAVRAARLCGETDGSKPAREAVKPSQAPPPVPPPTPPLPPPPSPASWEPTQPTHHSLLSRQLGLTEHAPLSLCRRRRTTSHTAYLLSS